MWLGFCVVLTAEPSPKSQLYEYVGFPPVAVPVKLTASGTWPDVGVAAAEAASGLPTALTFVVTVEPNQRVVIDPPEGLFE